MSIKDKVCVVTGGSRGIGLEICKYLLAGGAKIALIGTRDETAQKAVTNGGASTADTDVGYVRVNASGTTITITTCYTTACSTTTNVSTNTVEVE